MGFLVVLAATVAAVALGRNAIRRYPVAFYAIAAAFDVLLLASLLGNLPLWLDQLTIVAVRRGGVGMALFVLVMYIGVFSRDGRVAHWFKPIRAELSIAACICIVGHIAAYGGVYLTSVLKLQVPQAHMVPGFIAALGLLVLLAVLGVTSLRAVKRRMSMHQWAKLQRWAYVFYALVYVHLMLMLVPSAISGSETSLVNCAVYTVVFGLYAVLRIRRAALGRRGSAVGE